MVRVDVCTYPVYQVSSHKAWEILNIEKLEYRKFEYRKFDYRKNLKIEKKTKNLNIGKFENQKV